MKHPDYGFEYDHGSLLTRAYRDLLADRLLSQTPESPVVAEARAAITEYAGISEGPLSETKWYRVLLSDLLYTRLILGFSYEEFFCYRFRGKTIEQRLAYISCSDLPRYERAANRLSRRTAGTSSPFGSEGCPPALLSHFGDQKLSVRAFTWRGNVDDDVILRYPVLSFQAGGMRFLAALDPRSGRITGPARNASGGCCDVLPASQEQMVGFTLPGWDHLLRQADACARSAGEPSLLGWEIRPSADGRWLVFATDSLGSLLDWQISAGYGIAGELADILNLDPLEGIPSASCSAPDGTAAVFPVAGSSQPAAEAYDSAYRDSLTPFVGTEGTSGTGSAVQELPGVSCRELLTGHRFELTIPEPRREQKWKMPIFTVRYDPNGGDYVDMSPTTVPIGIDTRLRKNAFVRKGYAFKGWKAYRQSDGKVGYYNKEKKKRRFFTEGKQPNGWSVFTYKDRCNVSALSKKDGDVVVMYAQWKKKDSGKPPEPAFSSAAMKLQQENEMWSRKYQEAEEMGDIFNGLYREICETTAVSDAILFLTEKKEIGKSGMKIVYDRVRKRRKAEVLQIDREIYGDTKKMSLIAERIASARLLVSDNPIPLFCTLELRKGTEWLFLKDTCFPLSKRSTSRLHKADWRNEYDRLMDLSGCTRIQIPSPQQTDAYSRLYLRDALEKDAVLWGCCSSDIYFDENALRIARDKLAKLMGKNNSKTVLYIPTLGNTRERTVLPIPLADLRSCIPEEYDLVLNLKLNQKKSLRTPVELPEGCFEVESGISLRELIMACDIIIGDYRNTFFEVPLLRKPCFSTAYDASQVVEASKGNITAEDIEAVSFCPVIRSAEELAEHMGVIASYDYTAMDQFRGAMLTYCDGHSTDRVVDFIERLLSSGETETVS